MTIKRTVAAAVLGLAVTVGSVSAGGMAEPVMEPEVIEEQASRSGGILVPLLILALLVIVISDNDGGGGLS